MRYYIILLRSLTYAQRGVKALERSGLFASLARAPRELVRQGCGYGVKIRSRDLEKAEAALKAEGLRTLGLISLDESGKASPVG